MSHFLNKPPEKQSQKFKSQKHSQIHGRYATLYDCVDTAAAIAFVIGSALFFSDKTQTAATWLFLIGSFFFLIRPMVHVVRDFHLASLPRPGEDVETVQF